MVRIKVRVNGASTGALLKIGVEHDIMTDQQLAQAAAALLLSEEQAVVRHAVPVCAGRGRG
eukprot:4331051-Prymnesium_polylepis.1